MKLTRILLTFLMTFTATALTVPVADADALPGPVVKLSAGAIVGIIRNTAGLPVASATVTATRTDGGGIRATISGSDGMYSFADVPPGAWSLTAQIDGSPDAVPPGVTVIVGKTTRADIVMNATGTAPVFAAAAPVAPAPVAAAAQSIPEALQSPAPGPDVDLQTPFAVGYTGWMNGTSREKEPVFDTKFFTPEIRLDVNYLQSGNHPVDHTISGSTEEFRSGEFQIEQVSFGGDFHWNNVRARFLSMFGDFATTTPRNDASAAIGQWDVQGAYKYFSEANAGYHFDVNHGLNVDAGVFVSYIGLFSYYNFDNWTYQPSFVSSNTPWFFNGLRVQWFPTQNLKIEPWLINGWQSYNKFNSKPGVGGQILWIPNESVKMVFNTYSVGQDNVSCQASASNGLGTQDTLCQPQNGGNPNSASGSLVGAGPPVNWSKVTRVHEDDSLLVKYYDARGNGGDGVSKMAFSLTADIGCEYGGGVSCTGGPNKESFFGVMLYDRTWFSRDLYAITFGGGFMNNPGRYLALTPPINGATAATGTPYFTQQPGQKLYQWDTQLNFQYMPKDWITWWTEATFRHSDVPYWTGSGGMTPPYSGGINGNNGSPGSCVQASGAAGGAVNPATNQCAVGDWFPDLRTREVVWGAGVLVKF